MDYRDEEADARDAADDDGRPDAAEADEAAWFDGPEAIETGGVRCGAHGRGERVRHATPDDVRRCYAIREEMRAEAAAEQAAEAASEVAYARSREAIAENGTWFGPMTEADTWGEEDDPAPVSYAVAAGYTGECEYGRCDVYTRCIKHREQDAARGVKDAMFRAYND